MNSRDKKTSWKQEQEKQKHRYISGKKITKGKFSSKIIPAGKNMEDYGIHTETGQIFNMHKLRDEDGNIVKLSKKQKRKLRKLAKEQAQNDKSNNNK